jgi:putative alpha-1,2-mannosidase
MPEMDEDDGTMGAWYVFSAMGLYPLVVGEPIYDLASPVFDKLTLKLQHGKTFTIVTKNRKKNTDIIQKIYLNNKVYSSWQLSHRVFIEGGVLEYIY